MIKGKDRGFSRQRESPESSAINSDVIAMEGLRFFSGDPDQAGRFFAWSGLDAGSIRRAAGEAGFGWNVLDYLMQEEATLISFARHAGVNAADLAKAHEARRARENWSGEDL